MAKKKGFTGIDSDVASFITQNQTSAPMVTTTANITLTQKPVDEEPTAQVPLVQEITTEIISKPRGAKRGRKPQQKSSTGELETRSEPVTLYFTGSIMEKIDLVSRAQSMSKNKFMTQIIEQELKKEKYAKMYEAMKAVQEQFQ